MKIQVDKDPTIIFKVKDEMKIICSHYGLPRKINMFDGHPKGIVSVAFAKAEGKFVWLVILYDSYVLTHKWNFQRLTER